MDREKHSVTFNPTVTVTVCRDEMAVVKMEDGETSQSQYQSQIPRCEDAKGGMEGRDTCPSARSVYSINTPEYPTTDADRDVDNDAYTSRSSIPTVPELSLQTSTSRSADLVSDVSFLNGVGKSDREVGMAIAHSRMERWKAFGRVGGKARGFLGGWRAGDGDGDGEEGEEGKGKGKGEGNGLKTGKEKRERKLRPFLRKYCIHPFSMRSSFRLVGWIEDPVGCCVR